MQGLRHWAASLKRDVMTLWFALRHPDTPWYARALATVLIAYALSPIDLIPDFIPVLGYLDDLILIPLGIALALKMIPPQVMADSRIQAQELLGQGRPRNWIAAAAIVAVWLALAALAVILVVRAFGA